MKILMIDIDTLRADHLGCYGYERNTSPNIDAIAQDGCLFTDYYCSDAPCLPSRAALFTGRFGIHSGVAGHGGTAADLRLEGESRNFRDSCAATNLPAVLRSYGMHTASVSTFAERHGAWWFAAGFNEMYNLGKGGDEIAQEVTPVALDWLERNKDRKDWFLHVHYWDPHTQYRTPAEIGNPFEGQPSGAIDWIDQSTLDEHKKMCGFHSALEATGYTDAIDKGRELRSVGRIETLDDARHNVDGYDVGVYNADLGVGQIVAWLKEQGVYEDTAILVTADHGEDLGELGRYSEHGCADYPVTRLPLVVKWPGGQTGASKIGGLHYNTDLIPTLMQLLGAENIHIPFEVHLKNMFGPNYRQIYLGLLMERYDGKSFANSILTGSEDGYEYLVVTCATHAVQRAVIFDGYIFIRTYHDGYCLFDDEMLYDIHNDPHETKNLAHELPDVAHKGGYLLERWVAKQMTAGAQRCTVDPIWTVVAEGGGYHSKGQLPKYLERLEATGRKDAADALRAKYPPKRP